MFDLISDSENIDGSLNILPIVVELYFVKYFTP